MEGLIDRLESEEGLCGEIGENHFVPFINMNFLLRHTRLKIQLGSEFDKLMDLK